MSKYVLFANQRGFSLLEVLVATSILLTILLPMLSILLDVKVQSSHLERSLKAKHWAQAKLEEIKGMEWREFASNYLRADNLGMPLPEQGFTYSVKVLPSLNHLLATVQVTVYYREAGDLKWQSLYTEKMRR